MDLNKLHQKYKEHAFAYNNCKCYGHTCIDCAINRDACYTL
ncbi:MAG: hypothetical protein ACRCXT_05480 [Paraclostridium sp.]